MPTSKLQIKIGGLLRNRFAFLTLRENSRPDFLVNKEGQRLELDFYFPEIDVAIEIQGRQHYTYSTVYHGSESNFLSLQQRDRDKKNLCKEHDVILYECSSFTDFENQFAELSDCIASRIKERHQQANYVIEMNLRMRIEKILRDIKGKTEKIKSLNFTIAQIISSKGKKRKTFIPKMMQKRAHYKKIEQLKFQISRTQPTLEKAQQELKKHIELHGISEVGK